MLAPRTFGDHERGRATAPVIGSTSPLASATVFGYGARIRFSAHAVACRVVDEVAEEPTGCRRRRSARGRGWSSRPSCRSGRSPTTEMTSLPSVGMLRQSRCRPRADLLGPGREVRADGVDDQRLSEVGVLVAERGDQRDAAAVRVVEGPLRRVDDRRCSACSSGLSAGLVRQLYSHGSMKKLMFTTSTPLSPA